MKTKDLIKRLQHIVDEWEPMVKQMGEHEIMIDVFECTQDAHVFQYKGFHPNISVEPSSDGVYHILSRFK